MSLYDDIGIDSSASKDIKKDVTGWSSSMKLMQSQLQAKKASLLQTRQQKSQSRRTPSIAPVMDLRPRGGEELHFNQHTGKLERVGSSGGASGPPPVLVDYSPAASPFLPSPQESSLTGVVDEYDPLRPNEYEDFIKKRREVRQREREMERTREIEERERRRRERHRQRGYDAEAEERRRREQEEEENEDEQMTDAGDRGRGRGELSRPRQYDDVDEDDYDRRPARSGGAAIAPPPSILEDSSSNNDYDDRSDSPTPGLGLGFAKKGSIAAKIMAKLGYKEGQGLGKNKQGMSTALQVEKTSKRGGKIIHEKDIPRFEMPAPPPAAQPLQSTADLLKNPCKVVLLRNMVGPGEVDEDLEGETQEECAKYGKVIKCVIFEIPNTTPEEAVRIFLEFEKLDAAIKAVIDLNGRFFGGRTVRAAFYNLDKFRRLDLGGNV